MPRHNKSAGMNLDTMGPSMDNDAMKGKKMPSGKNSGAVHGAEKVHKRSRKAAGHGMSVEHQGYMGQQATSLPGSLSVIHDVMKPGRGIHGIPGIISSTTEGPEVRQRLALGVIESPMAMGMRDQGPVHRVQGMDATAYNTGMVHLAGSRF